MSGYVINSEGQPFKSSFTHTQAWPGQPAFYHEIGYTFNKKQYKVNIIAESFEVARDMIVNRYGHSKGFNLDTQSVGTLETTLIADVSPFMRREMTKAWSAQTDPLSDENREY